MRGLLAASAARVAWLRLRNRGALIELRAPVYFGPRTWLALDRGSTLVAHERVHLRRGCVVEINGSGRVEIGPDTQLTYNCVIQCSTSLTIGARCTVAAGALLVDGNHRFRDLETPMREQGYDYRPLAIGDDVWIGAGAVVMADVGERAVVGANAVVTEPVPAFTVVGGAPARVISRFGPE